MSWLCKIIGHVVTRATRAHGSVSYWATCPRCKREHRVK